MEKPVELDAIPRLRWGPVEVGHMRRRKVPATVVVVGCEKRLNLYGIPAISVKPTEKMCHDEVLFIQKMHLHRGHRDIMQNYLICGDGEAYEGRGWGKVPMLPRRFRDLNEKAIYIGYIGDFRVVNIYDSMLAQRDRLLRIGVQKRHLAPKFLYIELANPWRKKPRVKKVTNYMSSIYL